MSWPIVMILLVTAGSFMTIFIRYVSLKTARAHFVVAVFLYLAISLSGWVISLAVNHSIPALPEGRTWLYLAIEGLAFPTAWLLQYYVIKNLGAANSVVVSALNIPLATAAGVIILGESVDIGFWIGSVLVIWAILTSLRIKADLKHKSKAPPYKKLLAIISMSTIFTLGMFFEKQAIGDIGVWIYSLYGWSAQFMGAVLLMLIFGRSEIKYLKSITIAKQSMAIGLINSLVGVLSIYALSIGQFGPTVAASGGKVGLTLLLAAALLGERNSLPRRLAAGGLAIVGTALILI